MDCSPPGSSVHGILQARTLEWVALPSSEGSSGPRDWTQVSSTAGRFFTSWATREALFYVCIYICVCVYTHLCVYVCMCAKSLQLRPTLCNPTDTSPPSSSVHVHVDTFASHQVSLYGSEALWWEKQISCVSMCCSFHQFGALVVSPNFNIY